MTKPELYRLVFQSNEGREVLADICRYVETMSLEKPGSAGTLIAHIIRMINAPDVPVNGTKPRMTKASGGRIDHG
jgi:hypothetical protein